ncbi:MAG: hypothetical protein Q7O66_02130 [Dehalococcoidia bacterium]|nr:hypothetical protein [Dehalococcoidia bacterium]
MTRVDDLQKIYPNLAREIIVRWEVLVNGIRDSAVLDEVSTWHPGGSFQSRDHDVTLKEIAAKRPGTVRPGYVATPSPLFMKNGLGALITRDTQSPYQIKALGDGRYALYEGKEEVQEVYFPLPKPWAEGLKTGKGTSVTTLVNVNRRCFKIAPVRFCEYFTNGEQCRFCNYNATYDDARSIGTDSPITINPEDTFEAYEIISSQTRLVEGRFQSGAVKSSGKEANMQIRFVERIASAASYTPNLGMSTPPLDRKGLQRLKDVGLSCIASNLEVWGAEMFEAVCPGKAKYRGHERYLEAYLEAVDIYGRGQVACNFVGGVSLMPENGHKTWQESRDSLIEGFRWLISNGVVPKFQAMRLGTGSIYGDNLANRAKLAPTEYYLDAALAHHGIMMEYELYKIVNKFMPCPLDCLPSLYGGDVGILALAGNVGKWLQDTIPDEWNWLVQFVSSHSVPSLRDDNQG